MSDTTHNPTTVSQAGNLAEAAITSWGEQAAMAVDVLVRKAIAGIEAGKTDIRPGLSNVLYLMSRLVPSLPFGQMAKLVRTAS
jgi:hypothetical protein